ncbi:MAG: Tex-like N-terminal domain-containing protein, partial [Bacillus sp. (in: firmicutes)]
MTITEHETIDVSGLIAKELKLGVKSVRQVIQLLQEGNTVPFIARYRKEMTGSMDEVQIRDVMNRWQYLENLQKRKEEVIRIIEDQEKMTPELLKAITKADKLQMVEDLYRPFKQKRRTRATVAKERGLEPFAEWIMTFPKSASVENEAKRYVNEEKEVLTVDDAINGAKDIIAEMIADDASLRQWIRTSTFTYGMIVSAVKDEEKDEKGIYENYYEYEEPLQKIVPHRVLALNRGEKEDILRISIKVDATRILSYIERKKITVSHSAVDALMKEVIEDAYKRLIQSSIEREIR